MSFQIRVASWTVIVGSALLLTGCDRGSRLTSGNSANQPAASAETPKDPARIAELLYRGGEAWSSLAKIDGKDDLDSKIGGDRFWIWPVEDGPYVMTEGYVHLKFHWRVRPGQKPPEPDSDKGFDNAILGQFRLLPDHKFVTTSSQPGAVAVGGGMRATMEVGAESGTSTYRYDARSWQATGEGWIVFYLATRSKMPKVGVAALDPFEPCSNLLKLKLKFERSAAK